MSGTMKKTVLASLAVLTIGAVGIPSALADTLIKQKIVRTDGLGTRSSSSGSSVPTTPATA